MRGIIDEINSDTDGIMRLCVAISPDGTMGKTDLIGNINQTLGVN